MKKVFFILSSLCLLAACKTVEQPVVFREEIKSYAEASARNVEPTVTAVAMPVVMDVNVLPNRIEYTETKAFAGVTVDYLIRDYEKRNINFMTAGIADLKRIALAGAAKANNVDLIVGATFEVSTTPDNHLVIKVYGYPATYVKFRNATKEDAEILKTMQGYMPGATYDPLLNTTNGGVRPDATIIRVEK